MGIRIGDFLEKNHKFSRSKILHAMRISGMFDEEKTYEVKKESAYNIKKNTKYSQRHVHVSIKHGGNAKAA